MMHGYFHGTMRFQRSAKLAPGAIVVFSGFQFSNYRRDFGYCDHS
jgi:hypothetical protein